MIVRYVWAAEPDRKKTYDTVRVFENLPEFLKDGRTQEEYDKFELKNFEEKKREGLVLEYEVVKENGNG